jgi:hypothetical protein
VKPIDGAIFDHENRKFTHRGREFEIAATAGYSGIEAQWFHNGKPIARYTVTQETAADMRHYGWSQLVKCANIVAREPSWY